MATFDIEYFSETLVRPVSFKMIIPNDGQQAKDNTAPMKTLFLLHGYRSSASCWVPECLLYKHNFAVVMPNGENAFYLDGLSTGHKYCSYVGEELINYIRKTFGLAKNADETYIAGLSMGGFGALHTALAYPQNFGKIGAMSPALIVHEIAGMKAGDSTDMANYYYYHECFGDLDTVEGSTNNPEVLVKALKNSETKIPKIFMCCGTNDVLLNSNRQLHDFLNNNGVDHIYRESGGEHDMEFWSGYIPEMIEWMFAK